MPVLFVIQEEPLDCRAAPFRLRYLLVAAAVENDKRQDDEPDALVVEKTAQTVIHSITYFHMESSFFRIESL